MASYKKYTKKTPEQRQKEVRDLTKNATERMNQVVTDPKDLKEHLDFMSKMHDYSHKNQAMMASQYDGALAVGSAKKWKDEYGLYIRKGQKAIKIFAPTKYNAFHINNKSYTYSQLNDEQKKQAKNGELDKYKKQITGFKLVPVFDLTQTTAKPEDYPKYYPNKPEHYNYEGHNLKHLTNALQHTAEQRDIKVYNDVSFNSATKGGYSRDNHSIYMSDNLTETNYVKTFIHEMAHADLHRSIESDQKSRGLKEVEAEMTAYVVSKHYDLHADQESLSYMNNWSQALSKDEDLDSVFSTVQKSSHKMIEDINHSLEQTYELSKDNNKERFMIQGLDKEGNNGESLSFNEYNKTAISLDIRNQYAFYKLKDFKTDKETFIDTQQLNKQFNNQPYEKVTDAMLDIVKDKNDNMSKAFISEYNKSQREKLTAKHSSLEME